MIFFQGSSWEDGNNTAPVPKGADSSQSTSDSWTCNFYSEMSWKGLSLVPLPQALEQKSKYRIEKLKLNEVIWKWILYYLKNIQPKITLELGKGERTGESKGPKANTTDYVHPSLFDLAHTHNFPNETLLYSPYFLYFCEFQKEICRALPDIGWTLCFRILCICSLSNAEVCKVPSAGQVEILQQTLHGKFGWNSWQQRAP